MKKGSWVTVVDNESREETKGFLIEYTQDRVVLETYVKFDANKVHFKEEK